MVPSPDAVIDIFLKPGEFFFGDARAQVRTLLGSCVSITMWHPQRRLGGMCHYMLPGRGASGANSRSELDGRYADDAIKLFLAALRSNGTKPLDYEVKLFGGGRMFQVGHGAAPNLMDVGLRNIEAGRQLLRQGGFVVKAEHLAGDGHRNLIFNIASGDVWVRHSGELALGSRLSPGG